VADVEAKVDDAVEHEHGRERQRERTGDPRDLHDADRADPGEPEPLGTHRPQTGDDEHEGGLRGARQALFVAVRAEEEDRHDRDPECCRITEDEPGTEVPALTLVDRVDEVGDRHTVIHAFLTCWKSLHCPLPASRSRTSACSLSYRVERYAQRGDGCMGHSDHPCEQCLSVPCVVDGE
jgi:hypothetical protein